MLETVMLHNVRKEISRKIGPIADYSVTDRQLESFLELRQDWKALSPESLESISEADNCLLLTFDDGYYDNLSVALPILEKYDIPCIIFCTTGFINKKIYPYELELAEVIENLHFLNVPNQKSRIRIESLSVKENIYSQLRLPLKGEGIEERECFMQELAQLNGYERQKFQTERFLSWNDISELSKHPLVTIGAHTVNHEQLAKQSLGRSLKEMINSKREIEDNIGKKLKHFSYPYGSNNIWVRQLLRLAGFKYGYTTRRKKIEKINFLNRPKMPRTDIIKLV